MGETLFLLIGFAILILITVVALVTRRPIDQEEKQVSPPLHTFRSYSAFGAVNLGDEREELKAEEDQAPTNRPGTSARLISRPAPWEKR